MILQKSSLVTLDDDKKYIVLTDLEYEGVYYVYLIEEDNNQNIKFCIESIENESIILTEVMDMNLRRELLEKFTLKLKEELDLIG